MCVFVYVYSGANPQGQEGHLPLSDFGGYGCIAVTVCDKKSCNDT